MNESFFKRLLETHQACSECPTRQEVADFFHQVLGFLFPNFSSTHVTQAEELKGLEEDLSLKLSVLLRNHPTEQVSLIVRAFFDQLPSLYDALHKDVSAIHDGDPAANNREEVIRSYPGFYSIAAYRIANILFQLKVEQIPRAITEIAHSHTGIDIHPGATIGSYFCIDHGTGIVIGESTVIGNHVKIYQGVTLGALSVEKKLVNVKRHPTIEDGVVLYAGATILGGDTIVGRDSTIGGNVWLTHSVPPNSKVYYQAKVVNERGEQEDVIKVKQAF